MPVTLLPSPTNETRMHVSLKTNDAAPAVSLKSPMVYGLEKKIVKAAIWLNIIGIALRLYKKPLLAVKMARKLAARRDAFRANQTMIKYAKVGGRYFFSSAAPGWPSQAFNQYIKTNLRKFSEPAHHSLTTLIFGITKKCGYKCEHCFEWEALNKPETLTREDILSVVRSFQEAGIAQIQLSGGEPLNRLDDIIWLLKNLTNKVEVWLYTSGYQLTKDKAQRLKAAGLAGVVVSLDHWKEENHDIFRGKEGAFGWAKKAVLNAQQQQLVVCLSLCPTKEFITQHNLQQYVQLAKECGVSFIQMLEPKAVGHYAGKDVLLHEEHIQLLEEFYSTYNFSAQYRNYPAIVYHGFYSRRVGCQGSGNHYVYVDTDGDVHNCTFCRQKHFSALTGSLQHNLAIMKSKGCGFYSKGDSKN